MRLLHLLIKVVAVIITIELISPFVTGLSSIYQFGIFFVAGFIVIGVIDSVLTTPEPDEQIKKIRERANQTPHQDTIRKRLIERTQSPNQPCEKCGESFQLAHSTSLLRVYECQNEHRTFGPQPPTSEQGE